MADMSRLLLPLSKIMLTVVLCQALISHISSTKHSVRIPGVCQVHTKAEERNDVLSTEYTEYIDYLVPDGNELLQRDTCNQEWVCCSLTFAPQKFRVFMLLKDFCVPPVLLLQQGPGFSNSEIETSFMVNLKVLPHNKHCEYSKSLDLDFFFFICSLIGTC